MRLGWASRVACVDRRRHRDDLRVGVGHGPPAVSLAGSLREGRVVALGGAMLTVETDPVAVEQRLGSGRLACPGCSGVLREEGRLGHRADRLHPVRGDPPPRIRAAEPPGRTPWFRDGRWLLLEPEDAYFVRERGHVDLS